MKRLALHLSIFLLTHTIGLAAFGITYSLPNMVEFFQPFPKISEEFETTTACTYPPRFMPISRGCGFGYLQSYKTPNGEWLSEGSSGFKTSRKACAEFKQRIAKAVKVVERMPKYRNRFGELGERVVLINPPGIEGKETASILWYDGGQFISFIDAPLLELALDFELNDAYAFQSCQD